jgi:hypothetical protein
MPVRKLKPKSKSAESASPLAGVKRLLRQFSDLKEENNAANNAVNRKKTEIKTAVHAYLKEHGGTLNDGVVIDGIEIAHRPNVSEEIDPQTWYDWFMQKKISRNQFFKALSVSVTEARNAIGNDQIGQVSHTTLSKTADLRIGKEKLVDTPEGSIVPFRGSNVPTSKQAKQVEAGTKGEPVKAQAKPVSRLKKRRLRV